MTAMTAVLLDPDFGLGKTTGVSIVGTVVVTDVREAQMKQSPLG